MPTFTDLYYSGPTNVGNPDLKPETADAFELGLKFKRKSIAWHIAGYYRNGKNIIDWVKLESEDKWHTENLTRLASSGFEANFDYTPTERRGKESFVSKISVGYMYNHLEKYNSGYISNYVLDNLKHKLIIRVGHRIFGSLKADWAVLFQDRNGSYTSFENGVSGSETDYKPFVLFDGKLSYRIQELNFFVAATNIFNTRYFDFGNIAQAGRWLKAGVSFDININ
jgi:iron complex outermembrane receptor protein